MKRILRYFGLISYKDLYAASRRYWQIRDNEANHLLEKAWSEQNNNFELLATKAGHEGDGALKFVFDLINGEEL